MGCVYCDVCDKVMGLDTKTFNEHVCNPEEVKTHINRLKDAARITERQVSRVQDAVFFLLKSLPTLEGEKTMVDTQWLRKLWEAAECQWDNVDTADSFLGHWLVTHRVLSEAFDVFKSRKGETLLKKLTILKEVVDDANKTLGYNTPLDMNPEDLA